MPKVKTPAIRRPEVDDEDEDDAPQRSSSRGHSSGRHSGGHSGGRAGGYMPYSWMWFRQKVGAYAFGTVVCGAAMVAAAAWMGGSLGSFGRQMDAGMGVIMHSAGLSVEKVKVTGLEPLLEQRALEAARVHTGMSMLSADPYEVKKRIESVDAVGKVTVRRFWPDTVQIEAETRQPVALWQDQGDWRVIDQHGKPFASVDPDDYLQLPRVTGRNGAEAAAGLLASMAAFPDLKHKMERANRIGGRRWDVKFHGGVEVALPEDGRIKDALAALNILEDRNRVLELPLTRIDARHPERFALRPLPGANAGGA